jgi:transcriptional regulator with XRE-family HTH domain
MALSTMAEYTAEKTAYLEAFAKNIKRLREERRISQTDLWKLADLHRTEIGRIEAAEVEPRLMTMHVLADALKVTVDELIAGLPLPKERKPPPMRKRTSPKPPGSE